MAAFRETPESVSIKDAESEKDNPESSIGFGLGRGRSPTVELPIEPLKERELDVLRLMASGLTNREIADALYLSVNTIKWHSSNIYGKLNARRRAEAVSRAVELGIL